MTILFHPSFDRGYYMKCGKGADILGKKVVGMAGLLDHLSLHNGLSGRFASDGERAAAYLADVGKCAEGSWIEKPFKNDSLGVAKCLLGWRDLLMMAGWTPDRSGTEQTPKLQLLSQIEDLWKARIKGSADRWLELARMAEKQPLLEPGDIVICTCAKKQLPQLVQRVLDACHTDFPEYPQNVQIPDELDVQVLHYDDLLDAYRQVAARKLQGDVFINRDNVSLNHILLAWGEPLLDATIPDSNPLSLQLFKLALSVFSRPLNIQNLLSYLLLPVGPIPRRLRSALANVLVSNGGFGEIDWEADGMDKETVEALKKDGVSTEWERVIWNYFKDKEGNPEKLQKEYANICYFLDPITAHNDVSDASIPVQTLTKYIGAINQWAAKVAYSDNKDNDEIDDDLKTQLNSVISYFKQLLEALKNRERITYEELEKSVNTIYEPVSITQARAQVGSLRIVDSYEQLVDTPESLVWLDCCGADVQADPYDFLSVQELQWLNGQDDICVPCLRDTLELKRKEMITNLSRIKGRITLVASDYHHNQKMMEHPLIAELKMQRGDKLVLSEGTTDLLRSADKTVMKVEPKLDYQLGKLHYAGRSESNTSIDTLINYPFDYTAHYVAKLGEPSKKELASLNTTMGLVAHLFIQNLVNDVQDLPDAKKLTTISQYVDTEYDIRLEKAVQSTGLILLLRENEVEYSNFKFLLKRSVETLVKIMNHEHLMPVGCELKHEKPVFSDGSDFNARIDMELKDATGNAVIFDFKWTYSSYYGDKIKNGTAIQLELYRKELEAEGKTVAAAGYYLLPKCVLETSDFDTFKDAKDGRFLIHHIDPPAGNNLFQILENSVYQRKDEILSGDIEEGEEMDISGRRYSKRWIDENKKDVLPVGELKKKTGMVIKGSHKVFADQPDSRFNKKVQTNDQEKSTTYPLMKGRLK